MSTIPTLPLFTAYDYEPTIFDEIDFPEGVNKDTFVASLLLEKGDAPLLYPSLEFNKKAFGVWSQKWRDSFERLFRAFTEEYDPLHNYDRREEYTDTENRANEGKSVTAGKTTGTAETDNATTMRRENKVSAYNEDDYQPDSVADEDGSTNTTETREAETTDTVDSTGKEDRTLTHSAHLYGNIGVTRSQEMLMDELRLRSKHNLYDAIVEIFANEFLIGIY